MRKVRVRRGMTKIDLVVASARYDAAKGRLTEARVYERVGAVWSDIQLMDRPGLSARVEAGDRVVTGSPTFLPGEFEIGRPVRVGEGGSLVVDGGSQRRDDLHVPTY